MFPKVSIIILNWNGKEDTVECIESLKQITYPNYEILLLDNGSKDGSVECFRERYPEIEIIENGENLGFARGNNVGIRRAMDEGVDYVLLLNNDTIVDRNFLIELIKVSESNEKVGIVGPKIYYYDFPKKIWFAGGKTNWLRGEVNHIGQGENDSDKYNKIMPVNQVTGCAMLIKSTTIKSIGMLDSHFFLNYEDTDFCFRANRQGYKILFVPSAHVWHKCSIGKKKIGSMSLYYSTKSNLIFISKWKKSCIPHVLLKYLLFQSYFYINKDRDRGKAISNAIKDFLFYLKEK